MRPRCALRPDAGGLGCDHLRAAGGDHGALWLPCLSNGGAARDGHSAGEPFKRGGYDLSPGWDVQRPPPAGHHFIHPFTGRGPGTTGLYGKCHGIQPAGRAAGPVPWPGGPEKGDAALCRGPGPALWRGCTAHPALPSFFGGAWIFGRVCYREKPVPEAWVTPSHRCGEDSGGAVEAAVRWRRGEGTAGLSGGVRRILAGAAADGGPGPAKSASLL